MDYHIDEFYQRISDEAPRGNFHDVIPLHQKNNISWNEVLEKVPHIPKGWFELTHVSPKDRIDFVYDRWSNILSYNLKLEKCLESFFKSLDDIGIFLVQNKWEDPYEVEMVYSLSGNNGFYRGGPPLDEAAITALKKLFSKWMLPEDFLAFTRLHDGFWKTTDCTGITRSSKLLEQYEKFQAALALEPSISTTKGDPVDPKSLIPFYESFGMPFYQCFWGEWYPEQEMGNVYYSSESKTISDVKCANLDSETLAFPTFNDWLAFYLERVD
ncbi:MAG: SMI1/KNR4 family protein [Parachlamydiaceae bacterium]